MFLKSSREICVTISSGTDSVYAFTSYYDPEDASYTTRTKTLGTTDRTSCLQGKPDTTIRIIEISFNNYHTEAVAMEIELCDHHTDSTEDSITVIGAYSIPAGGSISYTEGNGWLLRDNTEEDSAASGSGTAGYTSLSEFTLTSDYMLYGSGGYAAALPAADITSDGSQLVVLTTNGTSFGAFATDTDAANLTGTLPDTVLPESGVTAGTYSGLTIDAYGRVTETTDSGYLAESLDETYIFVGNSSGVATGVSLSGAATLAADGTLTLADSGVEAGTYNSVTVDQYGRVTEATAEDVLVASTISAPITLTDDTLALSLDSESLYVTDDDTLAVNKEFITSVVETGTDSYKTATWDTEQTVFVFNSNLISDPTTDGYTIPISYSTSDESVYQLLTLGDMSEAGAYYLYFDIYLSEIISKASSGVCRTCFDTAQTDITEAWTPNTSSYVAPMDYMIYAEGDYVTVALKIISDGATVHSLYEFFGSGTELASTLAVGTYGAGTVTDMNGMGVYIHQAVSANAMASGTVLKNFRYAFVADDS